MASPPSSRIRGRFGVHWVTITREYCTSMYCNHWSTTESWLGTPVGYWDFATSSYSRTRRTVAYMRYLENWRQQPTISTTIRTCMTNLWFNPRRRSGLHSDPRRQKSLVAREKPAFQGKRCGLESFDMNLTHWPKVYTRTTGLGNTDNSARWYDYQSC